MNAPGQILDLFAGPGGWSEGLRALGLRDIGIEIDASSCATRAAAGHTTIRADVAAYPTAPLHGKVTGLIASPPCQTFSLDPPRDLWSRGVIVFGAGFRFWAGWVSGWPLPVAGSPRSS
ncbi:DNA cytosine methyltransferase, partial [Streptomyces sp. H27-H5]|uniref:DNA cytosine methyltransferase n=1 Tax=Streptomyces sp. H27-H5 TaxID=2996460 RepID=UPI0022705463